MSTVIARSLILALTTLLIPSAIAAAQETPALVCFPTNQAGLNGFQDPECYDPATSCFVVYDVQVTPSTLGSPCLGCCNGFDGTATVHFIGGTLDVKVIDETVCSSCRSVKGEYIECPCSGEEIIAFWVTCGNCG